jgi:ATP-dependent RNA helicase DOB1
MEILEGKMKESPILELKNKDELLAKYESKYQLLRRIKNCQREVQQMQSIVQLEELKCRKRVLRRLGYVNDADVIEMKGRVACEISAGDELLLTEMMFQGVFNDLTADQTVALLSCFTWQEKVRVCL